MCISPSYLKKMLPAKTKEFIKYLLAYTFRISHYGIKCRESDRNLIALSDGFRPTFFGYHDKTPFSADNSKVLAMSIGASDTEPESECSPMKLGYFTRNERGEFENNFIPFAETTTWCWQQGCMLQWYPLDANSKVMFNTLVNGAYGSVVFDIDQGTVAREYKYPIYSVDPTGMLACTLNFSRLGRLRPGYGYRLLQDNTVGEKAPEDDGLFIFDLKRGKRYLLVSLAELAKESGDPNSQHYVNHATFSPDGRKIIFFHLWLRNKKQIRLSRTCQLDPLTGQWSEVEADRTMSHYCWRDGNSFIATTFEKTGKCQYSLYNLSDQTRIDVGLPFKSDGHPMFHPIDKYILITDTYPDKRRDQILFVAQMDTKKVRKIAALYSPFKYRGQVRCDLHPRWDRYGKQVCFDTIHNNRRELCILDLT